MKLEKSIVQRRLDLMAAEGVVRSRASHTIYYSNLKFSDIRV
jgi:hypothetical protein